MEDVTDRHTDELEETEEIHIDVTEDGLVCMQGDDCELFLNPGSESGAVIARAQELGIVPILACSIVDIGRSPSHPD